MIKGRGGNVVVWNSIGEKYWKKKICRSFGTFDRLPSFGLGNIKPPFIRGGQMAKKIKFKFHVDNRFSNFYIMSILATEGILDTFWVR